jgi:hypothetical protein
LRVSRLNSFSIFSGLKILPFIEPFNYGNRVRILGFLKNINLYESIERK